MDVWLYVRRWVYDLSMGMARAMSPMLLGRTIDLIPHTGVVCEGIEFFFGGGIQAMPTHQVPLTFGLPPIEKVHLGRSDKTMTEFRAWMRSVSAHYTMHTYDLFSNNCNHFSNAAVRFLLPASAGVPSRIMEVPSIVLSTPMGGMIAEMMRGMQGRMAASGVASDPFSALAATGTGPAMGAAADAATGGATTTTARATPASSVSSAAAASISTAAAPAVKSSPSAPPAPSNVLTSSTGPLLASEPGNIAAIVSKLLKIDATSLPSDSPHRLTSAERFTLEALPVWVATPLSAGSPTNAASSSSSTSGASASSPSSAAGSSEWLAAAALVTRIYRTWPRTAAAFPALCLARLLALREEAVPLLVARAGVNAPSSADSASQPAMVAVAPRTGSIQAAVMEQRGDPYVRLGAPGEGVTSSSAGDVATEQGTGLMWDLAESCAAALDPSSLGGGETSDTSPVTLLTSAFGSGPAAVMGLTTLTNVFRTAEGRRWACDGPVTQALITTALGVLNNTAPSGGTAPASGSAAAATSLQLRQLAAALAFNLCNALPTGSDTSGETAADGASTNPGEATVAVTDTSVQLLCALLDAQALTSVAAPGSGAIEYGEGEIVRRRLLGAGRLMAREGPAAAELALTLGLDEGVRAVQSGSRWPDAVRALAGEVLALMQAAQQLVEPLVEGR